MDDFFRFFFDVITITLLLTIMVYQLFVAWIRRNKKSFVDAFDFAVVMGGIAALIFVRGTIWRIFGGNLFPGLFIDPDVLSKISVSFGYLIGSVLLIFSFRLLASLVQFDLKFKLLERVYTILLIFVFLGGLSVLIFGVNWYHAHTFYICLSLYALAFSIQCFIAAYSLFAAKARRETIVVASVVGIEVLFVYLVVSNFTALHLVSLPLGAIALLFHLLVSAKENRILQEFYQDSSVIPPESETAMLSGLNEKDRAVVELLLRGLLYKEIADHTGISVSSVRKRVHSLYQKYEVQNRTELILRLGAVAMVSGEAQ